MFFYMSKMKCPGSFYAIFPGVFILDQFLKNVFFAGGAFVKNYHALFGMEADLLVAVAVLFLFLLFILRKQKNEKISAMAMALLFAGIASNLVDRVRFGFIIDYINIPGLFVFNLADVAILCGAGIFIWRIAKE